jgi:hypothetical protein
MERFFLMDAEIEKFCIEPEIGALEGLCTCFSGEIYMEKLKYVLG